MTSTENTDRYEALIKEAAIYWKEWPQLKGRPYPIVTEDGMEFWARSKKHELAVQQCKSCSSKQFPPWGTCRNCMSDDLEWITCSGKGTVYSFSVVHHPPYEGLDAPYAFAVLELDEGVRMTTNIINCDPNDVEIGMRVRVVFKPISEEITLAFFQPDA